MLVYLGRRLLALGFVLLAVSLVVFGMIRMIPGDPAQHLAGVDAAPQDVERLRTLLGLDQPLHVQYARFVTRAMVGDLGKSLRTYEPVERELQRRIPPSLLLAVASVGLAIVLGVPAGIVAALRRGGWWDNLIILVSVSGISMPSFWLALLLITFVSVRLGWLPTSGFEGPQYLVLPALTVAAQLVGTVARFARSCMLDVLNQDYIRTARAKGLGEVAVVAGHALRNAAIPIVAVVGLQFGYVLGTSAVTETVFAWPGVGWLVVDAIRNRDLPLVQGAVLFIALAFAVINLVVDALYAVLDPRVAHR